MSHAFFRTAQGGENAAYLIPETLQAANPRPKGRAAKLMLRQRQAAFSFFKYIKRQDDILFLKAEKNKWHYLLTIKGQRIYLWFSSEKTWNSWAINLQKINSWRGIIFTSSTIPTYQILHLPEDINISVWVSDMRGYSRANIKIR